MAGLSAYRKVVDLTHPLLVTPMDVHPLHEYDVDGQDPDPVPFNLVRNAAICPHFDLLPASPLRQVCRYRIPPFVRPSLHHDLHLRSTSSHETVASVNISCDGLKFVVARATMHPPPLANGQPRARVYTREQVQQEIDAAAASSTPAVGHVRPTCVCHSLVWTGLHGPAMGPVSVTLSLADGSVDLSCDAQQLLQRRVFDQMAAAHQSFGRPPSQQQRQVCSRPVKDVVYIHTGPAVPDSSTVPTFPTTASPSPASAPSPSPSASAAASASVPTHAQTPVAEVSAEVSVLWQLWLQQSSPAGFSLPQSPMYSDPPVLPTAHPRPWRVPPRSQAAPGWVYRNPMEAFQPQLPEWPIPESKQAAQDEAAASAWPPRLPVVADDPVAVEALWHAHVGPKEEQKSGSSDHAAAQWFDATFGYCEIHPSSGASVMLHRDAVELLVAFHESSKLGSALGPHVWRAGERPEQA